MDLCSCDGVTFANQTVVTRHTWWISIYDYGSWCNSWATNLSGNTVCCGCPLAHQYPFIEQLRLSATKIVHNKPEVVAIYWLSACVGTVFIISVMQLSSWTAEGSVYVMQSLDSSRRLDQTDSNVLELNKKIYMAHSQTQAHSNGRARPYWWCALTLAVIWL